MGGCFASLALAVVVAPLEVGGVFFSWLGVVALAADFELLVLSFCLFGACLASLADAAVDAPVFVGDVFFSWLGVLALAADFAFLALSFCLFGACLASNADAAVVAPVFVGGIFLPCTFFFTETALLRLLVALHAVPTPALATCFP